MIKKEAELELGIIKSDAEVESFIKKWCEEEEDFSLVLERILKEKSIGVSEFMRNSRINRNYGYNIINGKRKNPGRDKVLAMCIGSGLSVEEAQELLFRAKVGGLFYKSERDVWIAASLTNKVKDVLKVNILLESKGLEPLAV